MQQHRANLAPIQQPHQNSTTRAPSWPRALATRPQSHDAVGHAPLTSHATSPHAHLLPARIRRSLALPRLFTDLGLPVPVSGILCLHPAPPRTLTCLPSGPTALATRFWSAQSQMKPPATEGCASKAAQYRSRLPVLRDGQHSA